MSPETTPGPERLPPQNRDAERSVLGSMIKSNDVIHDITQILQPDNFYVDAHQKICQAIYSLASDGSPVDPVILAEELTKRNQLEDVGKAAYIAELWDAAGAPANVEYYARIVRDRALVRNLIHTGTEILRDAYDPTMPGDELVAAAERKIMAIAERGMTGSYSTLDAAVQEAFTRIDQRTQGHIEAGIPTGFVDLDELTAGLHKNEMVIIAARPSVGKTAFSLNVVRHVAVDLSIPVFFSSLEQAKVELAERLLCCQARVDSHKLRKGTLSPEDLDKLLDAAGRLREAKLFIDDSPSQSMLRIGANARRLKAREGVRLVVIDYLQLIEPENRRDPRQEQVAQISRRLKQLARDLECPVVALAQVNRSSEDRQDHRPRLADLRESGCLAGGTLVTLAETGERVRIADLAGRSGFDVWAMDETSGELEPAEVSRAFCTGTKPVFELTTGGGRVIRATANHRFRTRTGWKRLDKLSPSDKLAVSAEPSDERGRVSAPCKQSSARGLWSLSRGAHATPLAVFQRASASVAWEAVRSIEPDGVDEVFDLTVPGPANFVANDIVVHNSIEQDADTVFMLHRPDRYEPGAEGVIEVIVAKQRNGPTGDVTLSYIKQFMRYEDFNPGSPFEG